MNRLVTSLGTLIALMAIAPAAEAGSYNFSVGGHRFHVEAPRNCRSTSCVTLSSRSLKTSDDAGAAPVPTPSPAPVVQAPPPATPVATLPPPRAVVAAPPPAPPVPVLAAATSQPIAPPPVPRLEPPRIETPSPNPSRVDLQRAEPPVAAKPEIKQPSPIAQRSDDEPAYLPLGEWESTGAKGTVRIERCGPALCGFALTDASSRGESVLVNMKPKTHDAWSGSIYSRSSGRTYYGTMKLTSAGKLHVEACAIGRFWCTGNDWTRVEEPSEKVITTSRQWGARS